MAYATPAQLLDLFGAAEMAALAGPDDQVPVPPDLLRAAIQEEDLSSWSAEEQTAVVGALTRIQMSLTRATAIMDGYLGRRYTLPLPPAVAAGAEIVGVCGDILRALIMDKHLTDVAAQRHKDAMKWLQDVSRGDVILDGAQSAQVTSTGGPLFVEGGKPLTSDLGRF